MDKPVNKPVNQFSDEALNLLLIDLLTLRFSLSKEELQAIIDEEGLSPVCGSLFCIDFVVAAVDRHIADKAKEIDKMEQEDKLLNFM